jgi:hypothetical protein
MSSIPTKLSLSGITFLSVFLWSASATAIEPDELKGRVLEVNERERMLTLQIVEVGQDVPGTVDAVNTFRIDESTEFNDGFSFKDRLGDIQEQEIVTVELDLDHPTHARAIDRHFEDA